LLENIQTFAGRFESYAIQRLSANTWWAYAAPATFLIGFVAELIATISAPFKLLPDHWKPVWGRMKVLFSACTELLAAIELVIGHLKTQMRVGYLDGDARTTRQLGPLGSELPA
jgi:hypothetical protein